MAASHQWARVPVPVPSARSTSHAGSQCDGVIVLKSAFDTVSNDQLTLCRLTGA